MVEVVVCGNEIAVEVGKQGNVVVGPEPGGLVVLGGTQVFGVVVDDVGNDGNVPPKVVVDVVEGNTVPVVVGVHGMVVVDGSFGMQGGRVVVVVGTVGPDGPVVVVIPGGVVVVVVNAVDVLVVPDGAPEHPSSCNSEGKSPPKPPKAANRASRERSTWQMGSRTAGSSWAKAPPPGAVWAPLLGGWPITIPAQSTITSSPMRRRLPRCPTAVLPPR